MTGIIYLHGFASGPASKKAQFFRQKFQHLGVSITIPDLAEAEFERLTITGQLRVVERVAAGRPVTLIGSSMGGYLAALYAARHPEVERLVLLAPAFCFCNRLPQTLGPAAMENWRETGGRMVFHYGEGTERLLSYRLIEDALEYEDFPEVTQATLILHGIHDDVAPVAFSETFARNRPNVRLVELASGHELTDVKERLWDETAAFLGLNGAAPAQV
jgi:pimeloyl-ACP methyl ester carboxylesterase